MGKSVFEHSLFGNITIDVSGDNKECIYFKHQQNLDEK